MLIKTATCISIDTRGKKISSVLGCAEKTSIDLKCAILNNGKFCDQIVVIAVKSNKAEV